MAEVHNPKSAPKLGGQIIRQLLNQLVAVIGADRASLLRFNDSPSNLPVHRGHDRIDIPGSSRAGGFEQFDDSGTDVVVILGNGVIFVIAIPPS